MTLVECMVAMVVLLVGVLGVLGMVNAGNRVTSQNLDRDAATALARESVERAREISYTSLADPNAIATKLSGMIGGASSASGATFTTQRRGTTYTTTIQTCVLDDPSDGIGVVGGTACKPVDATATSSTPISTSGSSSTTLNLNVLGIPVSGGGQVVEAVCSLFGTRGSVVDTLLGAGSALSGLVSTGADTTFCAGKGNVAFDRQPSDATAVVAEVTWKYPGTPAGTNGRVSQRVVVSGPRVIS